MSGACVTGWGCWAWRGRRGGARCGGALCTLLTLAETADDIDGNVSSTLLPPDEGSASPPLGTASAILEPRGSPWTWCSAACGLRTSHTLKPSGGCGSCRRGGTSPREGLGGRLGGTAGTAPRVWTPTSG
ncbi:hypothetical protein E2C01_058201 [Portunus trituberculatus]|uniref:Secreted protein n=1 Tax=Portunus trituberculatus TaxID=210409 RepID=A0A5B7GVS2_PORTR|nr:hypothetical protein [Portunus trituberculatus]